MKKQIVMLTVCIICTQLFAGQWKVQEKREQGTYFNFYVYEIISSPVEYKQYVGTNVSREFRSELFPSQLARFFTPHKKRVEKFLNESNFVCKEVKEKERIVLPADVIDMKTKISKPQLDYIWDSFKTKYIGFKPMVEKGLTEKEFYKIKTYSDMEKFLVKYIEDCHFSLCINDYYYQKPICHDEGCVKSIDPEETYFEKETSNAYYARLCNCYSDEYYSGMSGLFDKSSDKDFLILDGRSNYGGDDTPILNLVTSLKYGNYKGTVVVLQDNYSLSSGEIWHCFGTSDLPFKSILVGTHSGGMNKYGNNMTYVDNNLAVQMSLCFSDFGKHRPSNFLGDGKGFEPDIWATTPQMKETLEGMGIDTGSIIFQ